jgi:hypothetical protein
MVFPLRAIPLITLLLPMSAWAADVVTGASPSVQETGTEGRIWITGRGFNAGATVTISGNGVSETQAPQVVPEAQRVDGGRGDGIIFSLSITAEAEIGARDITVADSGGSATVSGALQIVAGMAPPPMDDPPPANNNNPPANNNPPPPPTGNVDRVTRASPPSAEQGSQVNLWIVGNGFAPGAQVTFSVPGIEPVLTNGQPIPIKVFPNAASVDGMADGLQYFVTVAPGPETPIGPVDVTVTNPNGSSAIARQLIEIVAPGAIPRPQPGEGDIDAITGASPRAIFIGRKVALWIWGEGITEGAQISFDSPTIKSFRPVEVVENSQSHRGYSGIRSFLEVDPTALPGPVNVTISNPNGTSQRAPGLFQLLAADGQDYVPEDYQGECPDLVTSVAGIVEVSPKQWVRGTSLSIVVDGRAFACGAQILIPGGGLRATGRPRLQRNPLNPFETSLAWDLEVSPNATLGYREITVINPNNTSQTAADAVIIIKAPDTDEIHCRASAPGAPGVHSVFVCLLLLLPVMRRRRDR